MAATTTTTTTTTKRCAHCRKEYPAKPKSEGGGYYRDRSQPDGLYRDCVTCVLRWRQAIDIRRETNRVVALREQLEAAQREHARALLQLRKRIARLKRMERDGA